MSQSPKDFVPHESTDLLCWWCMHGLPQRPCIHLPIKYDDRLDRFTCMGNFCSWPCSKAFALDMNTSRSGEIQMYLALMRKKAYGKSLPCWPAPKRWALKCFGGTMSIEEFRSYGGFVEPPIVHWPNEKLYVPIIGGSEVKGNIQNSSVSNTGSKKKMHDIENSTTETSTLKLKRNKPLQRSDSKLENILGITRKGKETPAS